MFHVTSLHNGAIAACMGCTGEALINIVAEAGRHAAFGLHAMATVKARASIFSVQIVVDGGPSLRGLCLARCPASKERRDNAALPAPPY